MSTSGDILLIGITKDNTPELINIDTELFWNSFKYWQEFTENLEFNCKRVYKFLKRDIVENSLPKGSNDLLPEWGSVTGVYTDSNLKTLISQIELILWDDSFKKELSQDYTDGYGENISYKDEIINYLHHFKRLDFLIDSLRRMHDLTKSDDSYFFIPDEESESKVEELKKKREEFRKGNILGIVEKSNIDWDRNIYIVMYNA